MYAEKGIKCHIMLTCVQFDIGESYAGLVPISSAANETRKLFFWYFKFGKNIIHKNHTYHRHSGSFPQQTPLLQTKLSYGKETEPILLDFLTKSLLLGSTVALAAAPSVVSLPRTVRSRGKPAHSHPLQTHTHG